MNVIAIRRIPFARLSDRNIQKIPPHEAIVAGIRPQISASDAGENELSEPGEPKFEMLMKSNIVRNVEDSRTGMLANISDQFRIIFTGESEHHITISIGVRYRALMPGGKEKVHK